MTYATRLCRDPRRSLESHYLCIGSSAPKCGGILSCRPTPGRIGINTTLRRKNRGQLATRTLTHTPSRDCHKIVFYYVFYHRSSRIHACSNSNFSRPADGQTIPTRHMASASGGHPTATDVPLAKGFSHLMLQCREKTSEASLGW